ncbi:hypothetical protein PF005_g11400 [Phytophthora fragariae]|uniref:Retrotransposon gag domain-containing protein n=2 Tax=Phytophthora fragariae TaxID=53985 RepID=A0A6A4DMC8_9STRA|nr:hypothetical protein PF003_g31322 [Phytophthora fragariae]KAE8938029.1 hypothetical protein PF009_g12075 [Phytophthora fragariae]KAE9011289.1 hypothetical protein PF011_g9434 [Phytophthora fragariae]KAE9111553.1 hypothetical protein PF010_g10766 [Phytophthora fragariae]KAE9138601.1 hypothetical protein PF007_g1340 [Phytophthora fragariae]
MSLQQAEKLLIRQYFTKIDEDAIRDEIRGATKKSNESYEMFSQRLQNMADSLPAGVGKRSNAKAALSAFIKKACPSQTTQLDFWLSTQNQDVRPRAAMNKLVDLLGRLTRSDGVFADCDVYKKSNATVAPSTKAIAAMATIVDRKRKNGGGGGDRPFKHGPFVQPAWVTENTLCHKCKGRGHIARDPACPKNTKAKKESPLKLAAMKAIAEVSA